MASGYHAIAEDTFPVYLKGSVEKIIERCDTYMDEKGELLPINRAQIEAHAENMAREGLRVLAFAKVYMNEKVDQLGIIILRMDSFFRLTRDDRSTTSWRH